MFTRISIVALALVFSAGCQTQQQIVDSMEPDAIHVAQRRGAFELNCPAATATMLSKEMVQSPMVNPRFMPPRAPSTRSACPVAASARRTSSYVPMVAPAASPSAAATSCGNNAARVEAKERMP